jgi:hypothetical protein
MLPVPAAAPRLDQSPTFEQVPDGTGRRPLFLRPPFLEPRQQLPGPPARMLPPRLHDDGRYLGVDAMGAVTRGPTALLQARRSVRLVAIQPLVTSPPTDAVALTQFRHGVQPTFELHHEPHPLLHGFRLRPGHVLSTTCAHDVPWWATYRGSTLIRRRNLLETTPHRAAALNFYHPAMQEVLLRLAGAAGADVRRGVTVKGVRPGERASVLLQDDGDADVVEARLVVGADGRQSQVRHWGGFEIDRDPKCLAISGVLLTGMKAGNDSVHVFAPPTFGQVALLFPLGDERCRAYFATSRRSEHGWLSGSAQFADFVARCVGSGVPADWFSDAKLAGPLATFEAADTWVDRPYKSGVVLIGDAAASSDPAPVVA